MPDVKGTFRSVDFDPGSQLYIFDLGGNKYRLTARLDFKQQVLLIEDVMTHEEYDRRG